MTAAAAVASPAAPKKRGPNTPEGKARSAMNALKHSLRARAFGILPEEDKAEWAEHVRDLRAGYGPVDAAEEKLVSAIAVAMWNEIRADRTLVETMAEIPPRRPGRSHGTNLQEPRHALALNTAIRYLTAAGMATQRAQRAFLQHRKARCLGLRLPVAAAVEPANQNCTNEFPEPPERPPAPPAPAGPLPRNGTNDIAQARPREPLAALRARLDRLLAGPGPQGPEEWDLVVAIRAARLPGAAPYLGATDRGDLELLLAERRFDGAGLAWLAGLRPLRAQAGRAPQTAVRQAS